MVVFWDDIANGQLPLELCVPASVFNFSHKELCIAGGEAFLA